ncbi:conserved domain protein [Streptococcus australis ATCC 700641]|nr:conserved domain protein [Streptococcus australis ATCC 700641]
MLFLSCFYNSIIHYIFYFATYILHFVKNIFYSQKEAGTKVLASQLSLDCRVRRSG